MMYSYNILCATMVFDLRNTFNVHSVLYKMYEKVPNKVLLDIRELVWSKTCRRYFGLQ